MRGVWFADRPVTPADMSLAGDDMLVVDVPASVAAPFEQPDEGMLPADMAPYRAFLIPSLVANRYTPRRASADDW